MAKVAYPLDILAPAMAGRSHETWRECPRCHRVTKQALSLPGVLHFYVVCVACRSDSSVSST